MKKLLFAAVATLSILTLAGCASEGRRVPTDVEAVLTHEFNPTDLQMIANRSVSQLMAKASENFPADRKPVVYIAKVRNLTNEHINSGLLDESIAVKVGDTRKVRIVEQAKGLDEAIKQLEFQQGAFVDPTTAKKIGKMLGADYFIQGELTNLESKAGWKKGQYFLFTLTLVDVQTLESWKSQVDIQKLSKRGLFGW